MTGQSNLDQKGADDGVQHTGYSAGQRAANRWVTGSFILYLTLVLFLTIVGVCTETTKGYQEGVSFSLANASWRGLVSCLLLDLLALTPASALAFTFIHSVKAVTRKLCVIIALILPIVGVCFMGDSAFGFFLTIPVVLTLELGSLAHAILTHASQTREWWTETTGITLLGGVAAWCLSWLGAPLIEYLKSLPPAAAPESVAQHPPA